MAVQILLDIMTLREFGLLLTPYIGFVLFCTWFEIYLTVNFFITEYKIKQ